MKRIITYDVKKENSYQKLYEYLEMVCAKKLTESTYEIEISLSQKEFEEKMKSLFNKQDNVCYISITKEDKLFWEKIEIK